MSEIPKELKYTKEHEWVRIEDGFAIVGITDHAQEALGDITFVELPDEGAEYEAGDTFGVVESVKAASDIYLPMKGTVEGVNSDLEDAPETVNSDPYGEGWLIKVKVEDTAELEALLDADAYAELCENE
ncbi:glycine cleavage system protein GcvH [Puniceicoccus vermicola]|uniref:Glycine cleavage system H protein n=1 Tax=Puniceicoccus vermicola TaxID=388746 RepID=A0A7X1E2K3_9BACT|nr:glycine cleavage system protein GcvH [Puniceicoccus vermicola]MBC2600560.1 glycine cleavage system protein GcvH [Puniceicoccus vermicola]